jgi:P27 family predicted phage terminase small subunit
MGRRRESFDVQEAKGHPRKRLTKAERQRLQAEHLAGLLAAAPSEPGDLLAPPALLVDPRLAPALAIWREYTPRLSRLNMFEPLDRQTFATFCVYYGEFIEAQKHILDHGYSREVKTVSGDKMQRVNPNVDRRDTALKIILELSKRFGLTPLDRYALTANQAAALGIGGGGGGLFDRPGEAGRPDRSEAEKDDIVGSLDQFDSQPPRTLQ